MTDKFIIKGVASSLARPRWIGWIVKRVCNFVVLASDKIRIDAKEE